MQQPETTLAAESPIHNDLQELLKAIIKVVPRTPTDQAMLRPAAASLFIGVSRTTLHRLSEADPSFPRKIVLSSRCVGYTPISLTNWLAAKASQV
jgi:predicted DNA-binding transcriptional regulator AlpA